MAKASSAGLETLGHLNCNIPRRPRMGGERSPEVAAANFVKRRSLPSAVFQGHAHPGPQSIPSSSRGLPLSDARSIRPTEEKSKQIVAVPQVIRKVVADDSLEFSTIIGQQTRGRRVAPLLAILLTAACAIRLLL
jgi:hypothetical protein